MKPIRPKFFFALSLLLLTIGIACLSVYLYSKSATRRPEDIHQTAVKTRKIKMPDGEPDQSGAARRLKTESESIAVDALKRTDLNLKLWGTITGNGVSAQAIIEETTHRRQKLYRAGDVVQNATIKMIFREKVVLSVDDRYEILTIETGRLDVNAKDEYGVTALIDASFEGQKEVVELLIIEGADLNARDNKGDTALMGAAIRGHSEILELLIGNGADVDAKDNAGNTALMDAAKYERESTCDLMALLIDYGAEVDAQNKYGITALMNAAQWGHTENVACLIAEGADINAKAKSGASALKLSELSEHKDVIELLKMHGAEAD
jgi:hypothetical protein